MSVADLTRAVRKAINKIRDEAAANRGIKSAKMVGTNSVLINNRVYPASIAVDMTVSDGEYVYVLLTNTGRAVVVGK